MPSYEKTIAGVPADTYQAARQVYNLQHIYLIIGDRFDELLSGVNIRLHDPYATWHIDQAARLALVTAFQYAEWIPDQMASDASRRRVDWKYALHLPVQHQGIDARTLCTFRQGLLVSAPGLHEYNRLLDRLGSIGLYPSAERDRLAAEEVVRMVCKITRLHALRWGMKAAMVTLAASSPDWLRSHMPPHWYSRYKTGPLSQPGATSAQELEEEAARLGADIQFLRAALCEADLAHLCDLPEVRHITRLFEEQFLFSGDQARWQPPNCAGCAMPRLGEIRS